MIVADVESVFGEGFDDVVTVSITKAFCRVMLLVDSYDIFWTDGQPTDGQRALLEDGTAEITQAANES
jgi:hypothetical protein